MAKETEFISERDTVGGMRRTGPRVIRVRRISEYGGKAHYYMDGLRWPVPAVLRHLDGRTWRGLALGLLLLVAVAVAAARLLLGGKSDGP